MLTFRESLKRLMDEMGLSQRQVCGMTGCSAASISKYLSGKNVPPVQKQRQIAEALGMDPGYFQADRPPVAAMAVRQGQMKRLLPEDAGKVLGIGKEAVRAGLRQGVFPWGYGILMPSGKWVYVINAERFAQIEGVMP